MRALLPTIALLALAGCVTPAKQPLRDAYACTGGQPGTPGADDCVAPGVHRYAQEPVEQGRALGIVGLTIGTLVF